MAWIGLYSSTLHKFATTWRIQLSDPCLAMMHLYVKLLVVRLNVQTFLARETRDGGKDVKLLVVRLNVQMFLARETRGGGNDYTTCPVCNEPINGSPEELNEHVEYCLSRVGRYLVANICHCLPRMQWRYHAGAEGTGQAPKFSCTLDTLWLSTHCGHLILRKISKFDASRCQILRLKCT